MTWHLSGAPFCLSKFSIDCSDCYEPSFESNASFAAKFADNLEGVFVFMNGSDAAGSYQVLWVFRRDARHSRFSGACSDCGFIDFSSGFFR